MCILFVYTDPDPAQDGYRLIVASNRDEYYVRPAKKAFKCETTGVIAGRDMEVGREGGSWLGMSTYPTDAYKYRFGALLNVTGESKESHKGRGFIVIDYLEGTMPIEDYQQYLHKDDVDYHSYNFVSIDLGKEITIRHTTNAENETDSSFDGTRKQVLAFGNSTVTTPLQKVLAGRSQFESIVNKLNSKKLSGQLTYQLIELLKLTERHLPDPELQRRAPKSYKELSSIYVEMVQPGYGTRTHTVILVDHDWNLQFKEVTMKEPINAEQPEWEDTNITD